MNRLKFALLDQGHKCIDVAERAGIAPETLSRLANGKQPPSYAEGGSAERIAQAIGWPKEGAAELFEEVEVR